MRVTLSDLRRRYKELVKGVEAGKDTEMYIDEVISYDFWSLKKVRKAFEKYIGPEDRPNRINPNPYDTPTYYLMKPSEQGTVEGMFMDEVLTGKRTI